MAIFFPPATDDGAESVPKPRSRGRRIALRLLAVVAALVVVTVAAAGVYVGSVSKAFTSNVHRQSLLPPAGLDNPGGSTGSAASARPAKGKTEAVNYVLMGSDSRAAGDAGAGRSDTLMVMHLAADRKKAYLVSFPRDMYVAIPGYGKNKINAAFAYGGAPLTVRTLEGMLGTRMDHVALVDFDGFIDLTTELGGVTVVNKHASKSRGYTFPAGEITVKGDEALAYVRERYELPNGDLDRAERQRTVVQAILKKGLSPETISDPAKFTGFVSGIGQHLTVDDDLTNAEIRRTALSLRLAPSDVESLQAPITGFGTVNGQSIDVVDHAQLAKLGQALDDDTMADYLDRYGRK